MNGLRILSALVYLAWGVLAVIQALHGWNSLVLACTFLVLLLWIYSRYQPEQNRNGKTLNRLVEKAISLGLILLCAGLWFLLRAFPVPLVSACWAGVASVVLVRFLYSPIQATRMTALCAAGFVSGFGVFVSGCLLWLSIDDPRDAFEGLLMLPTHPMRVAAVCVIAISPISLPAAIYVFWKEFTGAAGNVPLRDDTCHAEFTPEER